MSEESRLRRLAGIADLEPHHDHAEGGKVFTFAVAAGDEIKAVELESTSVLQAYNPDQCTKKGFLKGVRVAAKFLVNGVIVTNNMGCFHAIVEWHHQTESLVRVHPKNCRFTTDDRACTGNDHHLNRPLLAARLWAHMNHPQLKDCIRVIGGPVTQLQPTKQPIFIPAPREATPEEIAVVGSKAASTGPTRISVAPQANEAIADIDLAEAMMSLPAPPTLCNVESMTLNPTTGAVTGSPTALLWYTTCKDLLKSEKAPRAAKEILPNSKREGVLKFMRDDARTYTDIFEFWKDENTAAHDASPAVMGHLRQFKCGRRRNGATIDGKKYKLVETDVEVPRINLTTGNASDVTKAGFQLVEDL